MADKPQKPTNGVVAVRERQLDKIIRERVHSTGIVDTQMHRAGALRMMLISMFAFIHTFREKYKVVLEFGGGNHIDVTEALLMRVRIVLRNGAKNEGE